MTSTINYATPALVAREESSSACVSVAPDDNGHVPPGSCGALFMYNPSFAAAAVTAGLFAIVTLAHVFLAVKYKKGFCWVVIMGTLWEFLSFALRTYSTKHQQNQNVNTQSFMLFLLAPLWINAFVYMVAGRLIFCFHPTKRVFKFKATHIGRLFILADILSFLVQLGGGLMITPGADESRVDLGLRIYQAGLGLQEAFVVLFFVVLVGFHVTMHNLERSGWRDSHNRKWWLMTWILHFSLFLITARIIYRLLEFILPHDDSNPLLTNEIYLYVLDAFPMLLALAALVIIHPGRILVGPGSNYRMEKKQLKAQEKAKKKAGITEEEESMMGIELHQAAGGQPPWAAGGAQSASYSPLTHTGQNHGVVGGQGQGTMYDPHYGRP